MRAIRILLVDIDEDDFILTRTILASDPGSRFYQLSWCNNYQKAINAMLKSYYDIYLVDYRLGEYSGLDLLNEAVKSNCMEPVIILAEENDSKLDNRALRMGAAGFLSKNSIATETLTRIIRYAVRHHKVLGQLKRNEYKFRIIFERSKDPMLITDARGTIYEVNTAAQTFLESNLINRNVLDFYRHKHSREKFISIMETQGSADHFEAEIITASGKIKRCSVSSFLQISQHGHKEFYYSVIRDLTSSSNHPHYPVFDESETPPECAAGTLASAIYNPLSNINFALEELKNNYSDDEKTALLDLIRESSKHISSLASSVSTRATNNRIKE